MGELVPGRFPSLLKEMYAGRRTGLLHLTKAESYGIRFVNGAIVYCESGKREFHLGEVMVAEGLLDQDGLERATQRMLREKKRLGQVLKEMGLADRERLEQAFAIHIRQILSRVFAWMGGSYSFEESITVDEFDHPRQLSTGELILETVSELSDRPVVTYALGPRACVFLPSNDPLTRFQKLTLAPHDGFVFSRIDGTLSIDEILKVTPLPPEQVERSLLALYCTGLIENACPPAARERADPSVEKLRNQIQETYDGLASRNHYQVLGVEATATPTQIRAAQLDLAKRFHPDTQHQLGQGHLRDKLEAIFQRVNVAHQILSDPDSRARYHKLVGLEPPREPDAEIELPPESMADIQRAQERYRKAGERLREGRHWEAVALLEESLQTAGRRLRPRIWIMLAQAYLKNPAWSQQAERVLQTAIQEEPEDADVHFMLGAIYKDRGQNKRAADKFREVLGMEPRHRAATSELEALDPPPPKREEPKGFLQRLFRRR
jgi:curved DNA-binding protein CbpA